MTRRLLKYTGKDPAAVDPYWDFEHLSGGPYDHGALRVWRLRVLVNKPADARVRVSREDLHAGAALATAQPPSVKVEDCLFRCDSGPDRDPNSYHALERSVVEIEPPSATFAVNLTQLGPGHFIVNADVLRAAASNREMTFRIARGAYYAYPAVPPGKAPVVRTHTGVQQVSSGGRVIRVVGYRWRVERWEWEAGAYHRRASSKVVAEVVIGEGKPRWRMESPEGEPSSDEWQNDWSSYASRAGTGLEPPTLVGATGR